MEKDYEAEIDETLALPNARVSYKKICLRVIRRKSDNTLLRYKEIMIKYQKRSTRQLDLKPLFEQKNFVSFEIEFLNRKMNCLFKANKNSVNAFEASLSITWSEFNNLNDDLIQEIEFVRVYTRIPLFIEFKDKFIKPASEKKLFQCKFARNLIYEARLSLLKSKLVKDYHKICDSSMIKVYENRNNLILGIWNGENEIQNLAFITLNLVFQKSLLTNILTYKSNASVDQEQEHTPNKNDVQLDNKFGLHDYNVYFGIRNQTQTQFASQKILVYKADFKMCLPLGKKSLLLEVINFQDPSLFQTDIMSLPKFEWSSEAFKNNCIDNLGIFDICIQDSNLEIILFKSYPVMINKDTSKSSFISEQALSFKIQDSPFYIETFINCLGVSSNKF